MLFPVSSVIACLKVCADIQECFSVNYFVPHGLCELNSYNYLIRLMQLAMYGMTVPTNCYSKLQDTFVQLVFQAETTYIAWSVTCDPCHLLYVWAWSLLESSCCLVFQATRCNYSNCIIYSLKRIVALWIAAYHEIEI